MIARFQDVFADRFQLTTADHRTRPMVEGLEERTLFSVAPVAAAALAHHNGGGFVQALKHHHHPQQQQSSVLPLKITNIVNQNGQLVALGKIGVNPLHGADYAHYDRRTDQAGDLDPDPAPATGADPSEPAGPERGHQQDLP